MFTENLPSFEKLESTGQLMGYHQYDPVYKLGQKMYIALDYLNKDGKLCWHVHRYYSKNGRRLTKGYNPMTGDAQ